MRRNLKSLLLLLGLTIAAAGIAVSYPQRVNRPLPPALDRLSEAKRVEIKDQAGQIVLSGEFSTTSDTKTETERTAMMTGAGTSNGKAEIELVKAGGAFSKQEMEVALEGLAAAADFKLFVDDAEVFSFKTDKGGKAAMKFGSKNIKK